MSRNPTTRRPRRAPAPALNRTPAPQPDPESYRRFIDARTLRVDSAEKGRWTPVTAMYADYDAWLAQAYPGQPPLPELEFANELRADQRHFFEHLNVRADFSTPDPDIKECVNRAFRPAIRMREAA